MEAFFGIAYLAYPSKEKLKRGNTIEIILQSSLIGIVVYAVNKYAKKNLLHAPMETIAISLSGQNIHLSPTDYLSIGLRIYM